MTHRVVLLASAEQDLKDLRAYLLKNFSSEMWGSTYTLIKHTIRQLQHFPEAGTIPDELEKLHLVQYRQVLAGRNRIIYEVRQEVIYVHMIVDVRRDMKALVARRLLRVT